MIDTQDETPLTIDLHRHGRICNNWYVFAGQTDANECNMVVLVSVGGHFIQLPSCGFKPGVRRSRRDFLLKFSVRSVVSPGLAFKLIKALIVAVRQLYSGK